MSKSRTSGRKSSSQPEPTLIESNQEQTNINEEEISPKPLGSTAENDEYERKLDTAYKAELLGIDLPPVVPPGHVLRPVVEPPKLTFWHALSKRVENRGTLYQLYFTTALMVVVPLTMMGVSYYTIFSGLSEESRLTWSGFAGVLGVNIISIGFGIFAYYDNGGEEEDLNAPPTADEIEAKRKKWTQWELEQEKNQSREDRERLQALREAHQAKNAEETTEAKEDEKDEDEDESTETVSIPPQSAKKRNPPRKSRLEHDSATVDEPPARVTRSRSRAKMA